VVCDVRDKRDELYGDFENPVTFTGLEDLNKTETPVIQLSRVRMGIQPHRHARGQPREHPHETDQLEGVGFLIS